MNNDLTHLNVGDRVLWDRGYNGEQVVTIARLTPTLIIINVRNAAGNVMEYKFRRADGFASPRPEHETSLLRILTPARERRVKIATLQRQVYKLRNNIDAPDTETELMQLIKILGKYQRKEQS